MGMLAVIKTKETSASVADFIDLLLMTRKRKDSLKNYGHTLSSWSLVHFSFFIQNA